MFMASMPRRRSQSDRAADDDPEHARSSACMSELPGSDCAGGGPRERRVFPARSADFAWATWAPATARSSWSWACARGAAGPVAALTRSPGRAWRGRTVPGGQDASRWLLPGGQPGPGPAPDNRPGPAAVAPGRRRAEGRDSRSPGSPTPGPLGRGHGTGDRYLRFHRHGQVGPSPRHRWPAARRPAAPRSRSCAPLAAVQGWRTLRE
jgi:hypothetical protein